MGYLIHCDAMPQLHSSSLWDKIRTEVGHWKYGQRVNCQKDWEHNEHNDTDTGVLRDKISESQQLFVLRLWVLHVPHRAANQEDTACCRCMLLLSSGSKLDIEDGDSVFFRNDCVSWRHTRYQSPENTTIVGWRVSTQWARASSLSTLHDHIRTHKTR